MTKNERQGPIKPATRFANRAVYRDPGLFTKDG